jgi:DNA-directed RNA polymerase subunit M/transcription elongation factor TFIIS
MVFRASTPISDPEGYIPWKRVEDFLEFVRLNGSDRDALLLNCLAYSGRRVGEWVGNELRKCTKCGNLYHPEHYDKPSKTIKYFKTCPKCDYKEYAREIIGGVKVNNVRFDEERIVFYIEKKRHENVRPKKVPAKLIEMIRQYIERHNLNGSDYLFQSRVGLVRPKKNFWVLKVEKIVKKPISRQYVFKLVRYWGDKYGMGPVGGKELHLHHFRHSWSVYAAERIKDPLSLRKLQNYLEHSDISITQQYLLISGSESDSLINEVFESE